MENKLNMNKKVKYEWLGDDTSNNSIIPYDMKEGTLSATLDRSYDKNFEVTDDYKASLGDLQNGPSSNIQGSHTQIQQVGIHNFKLPLKYKKKDGGTIELETSVTGTVSLEAEKKGINMSRIIRSFYEYKEQTFSIDLLEDILSSYKNKLGSYDARIILNFSFPIIQQSLRSGMEGYQYYNVSLEAVHKADNTLKKFIHFDFVYSSACPCSFELAMQAMEERNKAVVSHSQRSKTRITIEFENMVWIEDLRDMCVEALQTETQVMVKREDEQAFAELNGANLKFVEDAARLIHSKLNPHPSINDFKIICSHLESLHSHDAISVLVKGIEGGLTPDVPVEVYRSLVC
jgi:GTP cyclohydrolase I